MDRVLVRGWSWVGVDASIRTKLRAPLLLFPAERVGNHKPQSIIVAMHRFPRRWGGCLASETWESNEPHQPLPRRIGFRDDGCRKDERALAPDAVSAGSPIDRSSSMGWLFPAFLTPPATPPPDSLKPSVARANNSPAPPPRTKQKPHTHTSMDPSGSRETAATAAAA